MHQQPLRSACHRTYIRFSLLALLALLSCGDSSEEHTSGVDGAEYVNFQGSQNGEWVLAGGGERVRFMIVSGYGDVLEWRGETYNIYMDHAVSLELYNGDTDEHVGVVVYATVDGKQVTALVGLGGNYFNLRPNDSGGIQLEEGVERPAPASSPPAGSSGGMSEQPGTPNPHASCTETGEVPGQYGCNCSNTAGKLCQDTDGPYELDAFGLPLAYCAVSGTCCGPWGHPEISCPAGQSCTTSGGCSGAPVKLPGAGTSCAMGEDCLALSTGLRCDSNSLTCVAATGGPCASSGDCLSGNFCSSGGTCLAAGTCAVDGDCDAQHVCAGGVCQVSTPSGPGGSSLCSDGGAHCADICSSGAIPQQACYYCQAACLCDCAQESCGESNRMLAAMYGTYNCPR